MSEEADVLRSVAKDVERDLDEFMEILKAGWSEQDRAAWEEAEMAVAVAEVSPKLKRDMPTKLRAELREAWGVEDRLQWKRNALRRLLDHSRKAAEAAQAPVTDPGAVTAQGSLGRGHPAAALCWGCELGIPSVNTQFRPNPLGVCWDCGVLGCPGHARRDAGSGKWLCWPSVAKALAASAGADVVDSSLLYSSTEEFEQRIPELAQATADTRNYFRFGEGEDFLAHVLTGDPSLSREQVEWSLFADSVGVGVFLVGGRTALEVADEQAMSILSGRLARIVARAARGH